IGSLVVDVGGGTSEMAVTALGGMVGSESVRTGGYDLDEAIVKLLQDTQRLLIGQEQAEAIKLEIGAAFPGIVDDLETQVAGRDLRTGLLRRTSVDAEAVRAALQGPLAQILDGLESVLEGTPPELAADIADGGVMLVGGGALLRGFDQLIRQRTGLAVTVAEGPLVPVALRRGSRGAARGVAPVHVSPRRGSRLRSPAPSDAGEAPAPSLRSPKRAAP